MRQGASLFFYAVFLTASVTTAQQGPVITLQPTLPSNAAPPAPTFRSGTKLVQVDVIVRDKKGPAAGLTKQDFNLFDDGIPQEISLFSAASSKSTHAPAPAAVSLPPGVVSNWVNRNGEAVGSTTVVFMDQKSTPRPGQAFAISEIAKFVETHRKQDRVGIYALRRDGLLAIQDITDNAELLSRAAKSLTPLTPHYRDCQDVDNGYECALPLLTERALETVHAFKAIARHLSKVPGRKSLIWLTGSFPLRGRDFDFTQDLEEAAKALNDANVALYAVDARGLNPTGRGIYPPGFDTMDLVSDLTGGQVSINTNGIGDSIQAAVEDSDFVYTLGFYPPPEDENGASHKIKVQVNRRNVTLRYRGSYVAGDTQTAAFDPQNVEQILKDSLDAAQIELAAKATPDKAHPGSYQVRVSINLHDVQFQHQGASWMAELGVGFLVQGTDGFRVITRKIELPDSQLAEGLDKGTLIETSITLQGPEGVLRIAVQDQATGAAGSLHVPLGGK
jgi:VWFA-related protein